MAGEVDNKGNYNMVLENARGTTEAASQGSAEASHQMENIMSMGAKFAGALLGLLGGLGSCGGGCGGI
jgi:hypothetical protein